MLNLPTMILDSFKNYNQFINSLYLYSEKLLESDYYINQNLINLIYNNNHYQQIEQNIEKNNKNIKQLQDSVFIIFPFVIDSTKFVINMNISYLNENIHNKLDSQSLIKLPEKENEYGRTVNSRYEYKHPIILKEEINKISFNFITDIKYLYDQKENKQLNWIYITRNFVLINGKMIKTGINSKREDEKTLLRFCIGYATFLEIYINLKFI